METTEKQDFTPVAQPAETPADVRITGLINTSADDLKTSLGFIYDAELVDAALYAASQRGKRTHAKHLLSRLRQLWGGSSTRPANLPQGAIMVAIDAVSPERRTQMRVATDGDQVENLRAAMEAGTALPPIDVFPADGGMYYIADGWHRFLAAVNCELKYIPAIVHNGGLKDALKWALGANATHGLRRSNKDKRHAVEVAVKEFAELSNRAIADICHVSHELVNNVRPEVADSATCRKGKDGKKYPAKGKTEANQLDFFGLLERDFEPVVTSFEATLKMPYWLDARVEAAQLIEGVKAMRAKLKDMDAALAEREKAIINATAPAAAPQTITAAEFLAKFPEE